MRHFSLLLFSIVVFSHVVMAAEKSAPNVIFVLVDDMGYADLSCYGSKFYETPNIDKLAEGGMKFTSAYAAAAICSPSRIACLTGRYPARSGITDWIRARFQGGTVTENMKNPGGFTYDKKNNLYVAVNPLWMEHDEVTVAEVLKEQNYRTGFVGKWHLGTEKWYPQTQGFDENFGGCDLGQPPSYFDPYDNRENKFYAMPNLESRQKGEYLTDREADEATAFIRRNKEKPFFLYLCHYAVHGPLQAPKNLVEKYQKKTPSNGQKNAVYAAMIEAVDNDMGKIIKTLEEEGLRENTLIIFTTDNGGVYKTTNNFPLRDGKGTAYEGGIRVPLIVNWQGTLPAGKVSDIPVSGIDLMPTIVDFTGGKLPAKKIDGVSLVSHLKEEKALAERALVWHFPHFRSGTEPYSVIRKNNWKLIKYYNGAVEFELYNLKSDIAEKENLAAANAEKVTELNSILTAELKEMGALIPYREKKSSTENK